MGKKWMALERLNDGDHAVVATDSKVVALGDVMGKDNPRTLANTR